MRRGSRLALPGRLGFEAAIALQLGCAQSGMEVVATVTVTFFCLAGVHKSRTTGGDADAGSPAGDDHLHLPGVSFLCPHPCGNATCRAALAGAAGPAEPDPAPRFAPRVWRQSRGTPLGGLCWSRWNGAARLAWLPARVPQRCRAPFSLDSAVNLPRTKQSQGHCALSYVKMTSELQLKILGTPRLPTQILGTLRLPPIKGGAAWNGVKAAGRPAQTRAPRLPR